MGSEIDMDDFVKSAFEELFQNDGLVVMARYLGIKKLFAKFAQFYCSEQSISQSKRLIFFLNANDWVDYVRNALISNGEKIPLASFPRVVTNEIPNQDRNLMYLEGGCFFITSRILIVDMLDGKVDPSLIGGILIANAHKYVFYRHFQSLILVVDYLR